MVESCNALCRKRCVDGRRKRVLGPGLLHAGPTKCTAAREEARGLKRVMARKPPSV